MPLDVYMGPVVDKNKEMGEKKKRKKKPNQHLRSQKLVPHISNSKEQVKLGHRLEQSF